MNLPYIGVVAASLCVGSAVGFGIAQVTKPDLAVERARGISSGSLAAAAQGRRDATASSQAWSLKAVEHWKANRPTTVITSTRTQWASQ